jgi:TetR/AcrR family transcriptional repressor of nem operon
VTAARPRDEQKRRTREAIVRAAGRSLRLEGIEGSTVAAVMKRAGLTVGGFYAHFDSKQAMLAEAMRATSRQLWQRVLAQASGKPLREQARAGVDEYLSERHRDDAAAGCLMPATGPEVARAGAPYRGVFAAGLTGFADDLARLLGGGAAARARALGIIALMYGGLSLARAVGKGALSSEVLAAARALAHEAISGE